MPDMISLLINRTSSSVTSHNKRAQKSSRKDTTKPSNKERECYSCGSLFSMENVIESFHLEKIIEESFEGSIYTGSPRTTHHTRPTVPILSINNIPSPPSPLLSGRDFDVDCIHNLEGSVHYSTQKKN
jgi:hypothetical protein